MPQGPTAWIRFERTNCYEGHGATDIGQEGGRRTAHDGNIDACKDTCLVEAPCEGIVVSDDWQARCYLRARISPWQCAHSDGFSLHWITRSPSAPPLPSPPPLPPSPPMPPRQPGVCALCPERERECGLPPPRKWTLHSGMDCRNRVGARQVGVFPNPSASVQRCQTACLGMVPGTVYYQTPGTSYSLYGATRPTCDAIIIPKDGTGCYMLADVDLSQCTVSSSLDVYILEPESSSKHLDPKYSTAYPAASYRSWFECHLLENGGTEDFSQLNGFFRTIEELRASVWYEYFNAVYDASTLMFPLNLGGLFYFHRRFLPANVDLDLQQKASPWSLVKPSELHYGDVFIGHYLLNPEDLWRSYRQLNSNCPNRVAGACLSLETVMSRGAPDDAMVEVTHMCCDSGSFHELWHYLNPGSGIFFSLGKTHVILDQNDFQVTPTYTGCVHGEQRVGGAPPHGFFKWSPYFSCLRAQGYDSVQISHHMEHSTTVMEIVNLHDTHTQTDGCPAQEQAGRYTRGWDGSLPCRCRGGAGWGHPLNCDG